MSSNGDAFKQRKQLQEEERDAQERQRLTQQAFQDNGDLDRGFLEELVEVDLEQYLDRATIKQIQGLVNRQWVLSNLTDAELHDAVFKLKVMKLKVIGSHPPQKGISGPLRAVCMNDSNEELPALTQQQRNVIDQVFESLNQVVRRSRQGFERRQQNISIARAEREDTGEDERGGIRGLF